MKINTRRVAGLVAVAVAAVAGAFMAAAAANATESAAPDCRTVVSHLVDRPDGGHGTPATWALDTMTRTVKVCHTPEAAPMQAQTQTFPWTYTATLVDDGTFVTQGGPAGSPNNGVALTGGVHGTVHGDAAFAKFTAGHHWAHWNGPALDDKTFHGSAPSGISDWIKNLWSDGFGGTKIVDYRWAYRTCSESWVDSSAVGNGDGTADGPHGAGDITGKPCASPSPSASASVKPSVPASATPVHTASATPTPGLPVTGPGTGVLVGTGLALLLGGGVLVVVLRRRRVRFTA